MRQSESTQEPIDGALVAGPRRLSPTERGAFKIARRGTACASKQTRGLPAGGIGGAAAASIGPRLYGRRIGVLPRTEATAVPWSRGSVDPQL